MRFQLELNWSGQATETQCHSYLRQGVILGERNFPRTLVFQIIYCYLLKSTRMPINHSLGHLLFSQGQKRVLDIQIYHGRSLPVWNQLCPSGYRDSVTVQTLIFHYLSTLWFCLQFSHMFTLFLLGQRGPHVGLWLLMVTSFFPKAWCLVTHSFPVIPQPCPGTKVEELLSSCAAEDFVHALSLYGTYSGHSHPPGRANTGIVQCLLCTVDTGFCGGRRGGGGGWNLALLPQLSIPPQLRAASPESEPVPDLHRNLAQVTQRWGSASTTSSNTILSFRLSALKLLQGGFHA